MLRLLELKTLKYEYLVNPYYCDLENRELEPLNEIHEEIEKLTNELVECDSTHKLYYEKMLRSFNNLKFRWHTIYESGSLTPYTIPLDSEEIADRHMGYFGY